MNRFPLPTVHKCAPERGGGWWRVGCSPPPHAPPKLPHGPPEGSQKSNSVESLGPWGPREAAKFAMAVLFPNSVFTIQNPPATKSQVSGLRHVSAMRPCLRTTVFTIEKQPATKSQGYVFREFSHKGICLNIHSQGRRQRSPLLKFLRIFKANTPQVNDTT